MIMRITEILNFIKKRIGPSEFSGIIQIYSEDALVINKIFGYSNKAEKIPINENTRFQIASGCKGFTATAIAQLIERKLINENTKIKDILYLDLPKFSPEITVNHLLTHTSGITSYFEEDVNPDYEDLWKNLPVYRMKEPKDFLPLFKNKKMKFIPGKRFEYNDAGYILLGLIVEKISGKKFDEYIVENIFKPAGMFSSGYFSSDNLPENTALSYIKNWDGSFRTNIFSVPIKGGPDGGAYTTGYDMDRFWKNVSNGKLISENLFKTFTQPLNYDEEEKCFYGKGFWIDNKNGKTEKISLEGFDPGVSFKSSYFPEKKIIFTMLSNNSYSLWKLYYGIEDILISDSL